MKKYLLYFFTGVILTSCSTSNLIEKTTNSHDNQVNVNQTKLILRPLMADLTIENVRKEISYTGQNLLTIEDSKANAMQLFLKTHTCDYVVDPIFSITKNMEKSKMKDITIVLTGFPAKYTKIYQVDSLPKSVMQSKNIENTSKRLDYINSIEINKQQTSSPKFSTGINLGLLIPLASGSRSQFGGNLGVKCDLNNKIRIGVNVGYYYNDTLSFSKVTYTVPMMGSVEYSFSPNALSPYAGADIGYYLLGNFNNVSGTILKGQLGISPVIGLNYNFSEKLLINCNFKYHFIISDTDLSSMIGLNVGIGYKF